MYDIDGDFGQVRSIQFPLDMHADVTADVPFHLYNAGWHRCNDLYCFQRENGKDGHLFLFSVSEGGMLSLDGQPPVRLPANSAAWIPPHRQHSYFTHPKEMWEFYWLDIAECPALSLPALFDEQPVLRMTNIDEIAREIEGLLRSRSQSRLSLQLESSRTISNIYHALLQERLLQNKTGKQDELIRRVMRAMEMDCAKNWNLSALAKEYFISVPQLIRRFKAETGQTPYAYLTTLRLQTAEMHLKYTGQSVEEISSRTGFASTSNFILQFRRHYGTTPTRFRSRK